MSGDASPLILSDLLVPLNLAIVASLRFAIAGEEQRGNAPTALQQAMQNAFRGKGQVASR
jgi:hypothetical protein